MAARRWSRLPEMRTLRSTDSKLCAHCSPPMTSATSRVVDGDFGFSLVLAKVTIADQVGCVA